MPSVLRSEQVRVGGAPGFPATSIPTPALPAVRCLSSSRGSRLFLLAAPSVSKDTKAFLANWKRVGRSRVLVRGEAGVGPGGRHVSGAGRGE